MRTRSRSSSCADRGALARAVALAATLAACGGEQPDPPPVYRPPLVILIPPAGAARFEGQTALLRVLASGRGLTYQWSRDGVPIPGATDSHLLTPALTAGDDGATFGVEVRTVDGQRAVTDEARLDVHPPLDLRFKWIDAPVALGHGMFYGVTFWMSVWGGGFAGPLLVGEVCAPSPPGFPNCASRYPAYGAIDGLGYRYTSGRLAAIDALVTAAPDSLVVSLDVEAGAGEPAYAATTVSTTQAGTFHGRTGTVAPDALAALAAEEGAQGRVITAVSFQAGQVRYLSYDWSEASEVQYEAQVSFSSLAEAPAAATALADLGYVVTAFGAGDQGERGVVLVGTRREGETSARDVEVQAVQGGLVTPPGFVPVGFAFDAAAGTQTLIFER